MKTLLATVAMSLLMVGTCYGQGRTVMKGSREEGELLRGMWLRNQLFEAKRTKGIESGRHLFGVDERWTAVNDSKGKNEFAGTLFNKQVPDFRVGDWGCSDASYAVLQKLGEDSLLASTGAPVNDVVLLRGLDCSKVTDGVEFILQRPVAITSTYSYTALAGDTKTVLLIECNSNRVSKLLAIEIEKKQAEARAREEALAQARRAEKAQQDQERTKEEARQKKVIQERQSREKKIEDAKWRTWMFADGSHRFDAKFVSFGNGVVTLQNKDAREVNIHWDMLSLEDQNFVRQRKWMTIAAIGPENEGQPRDSKQLPSETPDVGMGKPTADDIRSRWVNESYDTTIYHVQGTQWAELENKTQKLKWYSTETTRNKDFVEMYNATRNQTWRFFAHRMELMDGDRWKWVSNGHWATAASEPAPPAAKITPKDNRSRWLNESYDSTVSRVQGKQWIEVLNETQKTTTHLTETERTPDYVELSGFSFGVGRLYHDKLVGKNKDKDQWEWVSTGRWITPAGSPNTGKP